MSHILPILNCPNLQASLNTVNATRNYPKESLPFLQFLPSDVNSSRVLEQNVAPGSGKVRTVELVYSQRYGEAAVGTTLTTNCDSSNEEGRLSKTYQIDTTAGVEINRSFDFANLALMCQNNQDYIAEIVQSMLDVLSRKMESQVTAQVATLIGKFASDGDTNLSQTNTLKTIATKDSSGKFTEDAIQEIVYSCRNSGFQYTPFIFGYGDIWKYMQKTKSVCCTNAGIDLASFMAENQAMFMESNRVPTALGDATQFLAVDPGSLFLLQFNKFETGSGLDIQTQPFTMGIIVDPKTGISYNYKAYLACGGEKLSVYISTAFKVVGLPNDLYNAGDRLYGTNGVLKFKVTNP